jgi:hypothetical protein
MSEIRFDLLQPVDTGALTMQGFQTGMAMVKQVQSKNALRSYLANPDDPEAYNALAYYDPQAAATIQHGRFVQQKLAQDAEAEQQRRAILSQYVGGDSQGARTAAISTGDFDLADHLQKLDADQQSKLASFYKLAGPLAYQMRQIQDPEQRKAFLAQARPALEAQGVDPKAIDGFDVTNDTALDALVAANSTVDQLIDRGKITWHQQGEQPSFATDSMGRPVGTQNPYAKGASMPAPASVGGARGERNNNPLNLTKSDFTTSQPGYAGTDSGGRYAKFDSPDAGRAAGQRLLESYVARGFDTPSKIIERWAPAKENGATSTANYIGYVSQRLGISPAQPVSPEQLPALMQAMSEFENGGRKGGQRRVVAAGGVPHVSSVAEYNKLPSGAKYIDPNGVQRVKS